MHNSKVLALLDENFKLVDKIVTNGWAMLDNTPFYAESGGQCGDKGTLNDTIKVLDTKKFLDLNLSQVEGTLSVGDTVEAKVDDSRMQIAKHHSATHLLHAALREILGTHISQAGSLVDANRLRFDFSHPRAMSQEEIDKVEAWINDKIDLAIPSTTEIMDVESAKAKGAMALFGEKYGDEVRVVDFGGESIELCGGVHVENSAQIGLFVITKESGVSAGVRRIEAICGKEAVKFTKNIRNELETIRNEVKNQDALSGVLKFKEQIKTLRNELSTAMSSQKNELEVLEINGVPTIVSEVNGGDIKAMIDEAKNRYEKVAIMLIQPKDDKVMIACGVKGVMIKAGAWIKEIAPILGGGGGGRDDFATAGGKDISKISEALKASRDYLAKML